MTLETLPLTKGILFFDTETNDMIDFKSPYHYPNQPDVIQLCAKLVCPDTWQVMSGFNLLVHTDLPIHPKALETHGITKERLLRFSCPRRTAVAMFNNLIARAGLLVAHNVAFDDKIMKTAFHRENIKSEFFPDVIPTYCTMHNSTKICNIPGARGPKWPKLQEAYQILVDPAGFKGAHDAEVDVNACIAVYRALMTLKQAA